MCEQLTSTQKLTLYSFQSAVIRLAAVGLHLAESGTGVIVVDSSGRRVASVDEPQKAGDVDDGQMALFG